MSLKKKEEKKGKRRRGGEEDEEEEKEGGVRRECDGVLPDWAMQYKEGQVTGFTLNCSNNYDEDEDGMEGYSVRFFSSVLQWSMHAPRPAVDAQLGRPWGCAEGASWARERISWSDTPGRTRGIIQWMYTQY